MIKRAILIIIISQTIFACGFTPTLKTSDDVQFSSKIHYQVEVGSYLAKQTFSSFIKNIDQKEAKYIAKVNINESESAVNIESNGSVLEYKVEALIIFSLLENTTGKLIYKSQTRGFANYDVSNSEYTNTLVKNEALKTAITDAIQLMSIMFQSKITE
jgi:hypothetical protein